MYALFWFGLALGWLLNWGLRKVTDGLPDPRKAYLRGLMHQGQLRLTDTLINAVSCVLASQQWEDHHAIDHLQDSLEVSEGTAQALLQAALLKFPGLAARITKTEGCLLVPRPD